MSDWVRFQKNVVNSIRVNSINFLKRAANEIVAHDDRNDSSFSHEVGTVVTVLTQMSLELAVVAFLIQNGKLGIRSVLDDKDGLTNEEIMSGWLGNELKTKKFEHNKQLLAKDFPGLWSSFDGIVDQFQKSRNKIVHIHFLFQEGDLYDLKYEATYVLMKVVSHLIYGSSFDHVENISKIIPSDTLKKLVGFKPYAEYVTELAEDYGSPALICPICDAKALSSAPDLKCFSCGYEHYSNKLLRCSYCDIHSVIYDEWNLPYNSSMNTRCLNCGDESIVAECRHCRDAFFFVDGDEYCSQECAEDSKTI